MIANDKGQTLDDPCSFFCGAGDVESWARTLQEYRRAALETAEGLPDSNAIKGRLVEWNLRTRKLGGLESTGLGVQALSDFGVVSNQELVAKIVTEIRNGDALIRDSGTSTALPGSITGQAAESSSSPIEMVKAGAMLLGVGLVAREIWKATRR